MKFLAAVAVGLAGTLAWGGEAGKDAPPKLIYASQPVYPPEYIRAGVQGVVKVEVVVNRLGNVTEIARVDSPDPRLSYLAAYAVKRWIFEPGKKDGVPVSTRVVIPVVFGPPPPRPSDTVGRALAADLAGERAERAQRYGEARADFDQAIRLNPKLGAAYRDRGEERLRRDPRDPGALADLDAAVGLDPSLASYSLRGLARAARGENEAAIRDYGVAIALDPSRAFSYSLRAWSYRLEKDYAKSIADYDAAIRLAPDSLEDVVRRALDELDLHRRPEAWEDLNRAVAIAPRDEPARYLRGQMAYERGDYARAAADLAQAVAIAPGDPNAWNLLAWLKAVCPDPRFRRGAEAVEEAGKACQLTAGKEPAFLDTLAAAEAEAGDFSGAVQGQEKALKGSVGPDAADMARRLALYRQKRPWRDPEPDRKALAWDDLRYRTFQAVWETVDQSYYDPTFGGVDWAAVREKYRAVLDRASDNARLRWLLQSMLSELHRSHFSILPSESAVFDPSERKRIGTAGVELALIGGRVTLTQVTPGSPGDRAGLRAGDAVARIAGVDVGAELATLEKAGMTATQSGLYLTEFAEARLGSPVGTRVGLRVLRPGGPARDVVLTCGAAAGSWSEPVGNFPSMPVQCEARRDGDGIAYLRFNIFALQVMKPIRTLVRSLRPGDGLVIDLRGNRGGLTAIAAGISGLLSRREFFLGTMHLRNGATIFDVYPHPWAFDGPVAILVDGQSASSSEILAAGLQAAGRARIFGEPTAGAALPSAFKRLPTGDLLQYVVADATTEKGRRIEGSGVAPDLVVRRTQADLAAGRDPVLAAARQWLDSCRGKT